MTTEEGEGERARESKLVSNWYPEHASPCHLLWKERWRTGLKVRRVENRWLKQSEGFGLDIIWLGVVTLSRDTTAYTNIKRMG